MNKKRLTQITLAVIFFLALAMPGWATTYHVCQGGTATIKTVNSIGASTGGTTQVVTSAAHGFTNGQTIAMSGFATQTGYNANFVVTYPSSGPSPSTSKFDVSPAFSGSTDTGKAVLAGPGPVPTLATCMNAATVSGATTIVNGDIVYLSPINGNIVGLAPNTSGTNSTGITYQSEPGTIATLGGSGTNGLLVLGKNYLNFNRLKILTGSSYNVRVRSSATNIVMNYCWIDNNYTATSSIASVEADSGGQVVLNNCNVIRSGYGALATGTGSSIGLVNCNFYGNPTYQLYAAASANITYSYSHFMGHDIFSFTATSGTITDGGNNKVELGMVSLANIDKYNKWPVNISIDDIGLDETIGPFVDSVCTAFASRGSYAPTIGVVAGAAYTNPTDLLRWKNTNGCEVASHSWSHQRYTQGPSYTGTACAIKIKYVHTSGGGSACTMTITGNTLTTSVTGGPGGENFDGTGYGSIDLTKYKYNSPYWSS